jgi:hypothetical protein
VFDQISGLPVHVLILHVTVVFVPLLALGAVVYGVVPRWRPRIAWAVLLLSIVTPIVCFVTKESGEKLYDKVFPNSSPTGKTMLNNHMHYGSTTVWWVLGLAVVTIVTVILTSRKTSALPRVADVGLAVVMIVLAAFSGYYVYKTGDSGAHAVWGTY